MQYDVVIIGAGLSGLTAAIELQKYQKKIAVLEATDEVGGRVASEKIDNFILDKGFQVLLTAYPEPQKYLDYKKLNLKRFLPGALILSGDKKFKVGDPFRCPSLALPTLLSPIGSLGDKMKIVKMVQGLRNKDLVSIFGEEELSTYKALKEEYGFSDKIIKNFFHPFLSGIFLEDKLETSSRMLDFTFKMFAEGSIAVPENGMQEIPKQLAAQLAPNSIKFNHKVVGIEDGGVILTSGEKIKADKILIATEACGLIKEYMPEIKSKCHVTSNIYLWADKSPVKSPMLVLNANPERFVNNMVVMTDVSRSYGPSNKHLISVSVNGIIEENTQAAVKKVKNELRPYFGNEVNEWHHVHTYKIRYALPDQKHAQHQIAATSMKVRENVFMCGDHLLNGSINAAMRSGAYAAEVIVKEL